MRASAVLLVSHSLNLPCLYAAVLVQNRRHHGVADGRKKKNLCKATISGLHRMARARSYLLLLCCEGHVWNARGPVLFITRDRYVVVSIFSLRKFEFIVILAPLP